MEIIWRYDQHSLVRVPHASCAHRFPTLLPRSGWMAHSPDFLRRLVALIHPMRLSLMKGGHADLSSVLSLKFLEQFEKSKMFQKLRSGAEAHLVLQCLRHD